MAHPIKMADRIRHPLPKVADLPRDVDKSRLWTASTVQDVAVSAATSASGTATEASSASRSPFQDAELAPTGGGARNWP
ncbi:hypothetical protein JOF42_003446 [Microbacterium phyllosphaerae]|uniref:Uncharacterized protein n=1 Tax=Microbacterium phyllosphaerae TaxID=124798 RepID=A0ABS4WUX7_9MICO|nr:hypothetical protein [Microbacterium phyllosphaerae]